MLSRSKVIGNNIRLTIVVKYDNKIMVEVMSISKKPILQTTLKLDK